MMPTHKKHPAMEHRSMLSFSILPKRILRTRPHAFQLVRQVRLQSRQTYPKETLILYFSNVFPEPNASAAGVRTNFILQQFIGSKGFKAIHYATTSQSRRDNVVQEDTRRELEQNGVAFHWILPNNAASISQLLTNIQDQAEQKIVIFDKFFTEEMFSFQIYQAWPHALMILDMQDMHSLRLSRQRAVQYGDKMGSSPFFDNSIPTSDDPHLLRELASIHRCDLSLVCSSKEAMLLHKDFGVSQQKLCRAPLFGPLNDIKDQVYEHTKDFVFIGGFRHDPNKDAVTNLHRLWPRIKAQLQGDVSLHIYGAYCPDQLRNTLHSPKTGFYIHGYAESLEVALEGKRCMLAPLRFGAGIKGKIIDAFKFGVPVVTTPIGSEGIVDDDCEKEFSCCRIARSDDEFIQKAISLYNDKEMWTSSLSDRRKVYEPLVGGWSGVESRIIDAIKLLHERRRHDYFRAIIWQQGLRSAEYLSKYIETKEQMRNKTKE